ncbi:MAG: type II toxin-antitoxin system RelB/DinJ family antitoxin [Synergistaceae bacterium]|nr:type II toxin-antitoxin system RelB/DinJ family antitoxin [Synergistaceae bacterium]
MAVLQIQLSDKLKHNSDELFTDLGLDTSTAVRIFLRAAQEYSGFPFPVKRHVSAESIEAFEDARLHRNLYGPYQTAEEAVAAMLED